MLGASGGGGGGVGWSEVAYVPQLGYIAGGQEMHEGFMSTALATRWCAARPHCAGFTTRAPEPGSPPASVSYMQFSTASLVVHDANWYAWLKAPVAADGGKEEL